MTLYRFEDRLFDPDETSDLAFVTGLYATRKRPLCMCNPPGIPMYIAKIGSAYVVKRMPDSGKDHTSACGSYDPPAALSGIGELLGSAIDDAGEDGVRLKFGFSMAKTAGRAAPTGEGAADSVKADGSRLTLRGTLHYLWEQAGFNRWRPAMEGKRNWPVIQKYLVQAMDGKVANKMPLAEAVIIPEPFTVARKDELTRRRMVQLAPVMTPAKGKRPMMLAIGEVKGFAPSRHGYQLSLKHWPDFPLFLSEDVYRRLNKRFVTEMELWDASIEDDVHLVFAGTFSMSPAGYATVEEVTLMAVNAAWLPIESKSEKDLLDALVRDKRSFVRGMRYNMPLQRPMACAVMADTLPGAVACYVMPVSADGEYEGVLRDLVDSSDLPAWFWCPSREPMPRLPTIQGYVGMSLPDAPAVAA